MEAEVPTWKAQRTAPRREPQGYEHRCQAQASFPPIRLDPPLLLERLVDFCVVDPRTKKKIEIMLFDSLVRYASAKRERLDGNVIEASRELLGTLPKPAIHSGRNIPERVLDGFRGVPSPHAFMVGDICLHIKPALTD